jgi:hypothetical protein
MTRCTPASSQPKSRNWFGSASSATAEDVKIRLVRIANVQAVSLRGIWTTRSLSRVGDRVWSRTTYGCFALSVTCERATGLSIHVLLGLSECPNRYRTGPLGSDALGRGTLSPQAEPPPNDSAETRRRCRSRPQKPLPITAIVEPPSVGREVDGKLKHAPPAHLFHVPRRPIP